MSNTNNSNMIYQVAKSLLDILLKTQFISIHVSGEKSLEYPLDRSVIFVSNHSGWLALDGVLACLIIANKNNGVFPRTVYHSSFEKIPLLNTLLHTYGYPANMLRGLDIRSNTPPILI